MNPQQRELIAYLQRRTPDAFTVAGRIDDRRYLPREFPADFPLILSLQTYPRYRRMVGENWMHWHDYYEMWVATAGHGEYRCGNHSFPFATGDVVLVDPLKIHGVVRMDRSHAPLVLFFRSEAVVPAGAGVDLGFLSAWDRRPEKIEPRLQADSGASAPVHGALLRLAQTWFESDPDPGRILALRCHLLDAMLQLHRAFISHEAPPPQPRAFHAEREERLGRVLDYVAEHCHKSISQPIVARVAGMSTSRFRVFFKETTGWGFADYVRDLRLDRAARLLRETTDSVALVAYATGFADQSHLQRLFKLKNGISPLAYRKQHHTEALNA